MFFVPFLYLLQHTPLLSELLLARSESFSISPPQVNILAFYWMKIALLLFYRGFLSLPIKPCTTIQTSLACLAIGLDCTKAESTAITANYRSSAPYIVRTIIISATLAFMPLFFHMLVTSVAGNTQLTKKKKHRSNLMVIPLPCKQTPPPFLLFRTLRSVIHGASSSSRACLSANKQDRAPNELIRPSSVYLSLPVWDCDVRTYAQTDRRTCSLFLSLSPAHVC